MKTRIGTFLEWAVAFALVAPAVGRAQTGVGDIVYTVGTVAADPHGRNWAYLVWQGTQPGLISNRVFAIYAKPGPATNAAPYARLSLVTLQIDARVIEPLLERAATLRVSAFLPRPSRPRYNRK